MKICRVCLTPDIKNCFGNCFENNGAIVKKIFYLFNLSIVEIASDNPSLICRKCEKHVTLAYELRELVFKSEAHYRSLPMREEHFLFHENLRELKLKASLDAVATCSSRKTSEELIRKEPEILEDIQESAETSTEPADASRSFNDELDDFLKEAENMLIDALEGTEDVKLYEKGSKLSLPPVTKRTAILKRTSPRWSEPKESFLTAVEIEETTEVPKPIANPLAENAEKSNKIPKLAEKVDTNQLKENSANDTIEISSDDNEEMCRSKCTLDFVNNITSEQIMEMTALISSVLPKHKTKKRKKKKTKKTLRNSIKIDIKALKIISPEPKPIKIKKRRESILHIVKKNRKT